MKHRLLSVLFLLCGVAGCQADRVLNPEAERPAGRAALGQDCVVMPGPTNALQFRLYTNASQDSAHMFNTFDIEAGGKLLLQSPGGTQLKHWLAMSPSNAWLHNILVDGEGPLLISSNSMPVIEQAAGPDWRYTALDASAAYRGRLQQYRRAILFIEPDLLVLHDHLVAKKPARFQMVLHPPAATQVDAAWRDLRLDLPDGGLRIHAPGTKKMLRAWERIESAVDQFLPGTVTMRLGPTNQLAELDLVTVFAVCREGRKTDYAFKLLESKSAVGARIHRDGLPTLVAFKTDPAATSASLTGFGFNGPVGVDVFTTQVLEMVGVAVDW